MWSPFIQFDKPVYEKQVAVFDERGVSSATWFDASGSPYDLDTMAYYRVVTTDHTVPMYPQRNIVACKHCGIKHDVNKLDVWICKGCGAPL